MMIVGGRHIHFKLPDWFQDSFASAILDRPLCDVTRRENSKQQRRRTSKLLEDLEGRRICSMMDVTVEKLEEAFDDLGFELEDPKIKDKLASLCGIHGVDEDKMSCEYMAYLSRKKLPITKNPTLDILDDFDLDLAKHLMAFKEEKRNLEKATGITMVTADTMDNDGMDVGEDEEDGALDFYNKSNQAKRMLSPEEQPRMKRRVGLGDAEGSLPFSPTSYRSTPITEGIGKKYSARTNAGKIMIRYGEEILGSSQAWRNKSGYVADVKVVSNPWPKNYRFMFERLRERAGFLDETTCRLGELMIHQLNLEPQSFCHVLPDPFDAIGRICCDADGRLNAKSILLQGSQDLCGGRTLPLDPSAVGEFSLFPGQIVSAKVTNPNGERLIASKINHDASPKLTPLSGIRIGDDDLHVVVASGPYTTTDNLSYEPLADLLRYITDHRPQMVILCGPFVDIKHPMIDSGDTGDLTFDGIFAGVMNTITDAIKELDTTVVMVSSSRDAHHKYIYPTPPFEEAKNSEKIQMVSDPCILNVDGITFGVTSSDILFHLGKEEISFPPRSGDRLRRLATHIIQQRSFYPLHPPGDEMNIDLEQLENLAQLNEQPHVLILPSDLLHFFKDINGGLTINPQRLSKGEGGGVFARLKIKGGCDPEAPVSKRMSAEIVRI